MEVNAVAQHLDDEAVVMGRDLTDEICQLQRHSRGGFVARLLRQLRVARQVGEHAGLWTPFLPAMNPGALERRLEVVEHVLQLELLGVAPEQPAQKVFPRSADANTDLAKRRLERRIVAQALPPERLLDRLMQIVGLELGDLSGVFPPDACEPKDVARIHAGGEQDRHGLDETEVLLPHQLVGPGTREPERDVQAFEQRIGDTDLLAEVSERPIGSRRTTPAHLHVPESKVAGSHRRCDRLLVDAHPIQIENDARAQHGGAWIHRLVVGFEDAERRETPDPFGSRADALRDLGFGDAVSGQAAYSLGFATKAAWQVCEQKEYVLLSYSAVAAASSLSMCIPQTWSTTITIGSPLFRIVASSRAQA